MVQIQIKHMQINTNERARKSTGYKQEYKDF
jgi:hypothetical protein